jgi:hypothetical protein
VSAALNEVLAHGHLVRSLTPEGPLTTAQVVNPTQYAAWVAADDYLRLLALADGRTRRCAHPDCVPARRREVLGWALRPSLELYFYPLRVCYVRYAGTPQPYPLGR